MLVSHAELAESLGVEKKNILIGENGFLHVKDVAWDRTNKVGDVIKLGDTVKVKVTQITDKGVNVSRKALLPKPIVKHDAPAEEKK